MGAKRHDIDPCVKISPCFVAMACYITFVCKGGGFYEKYPSLLNDINFERVNVDDPI